MGQSPLISVIVPVYNGERSLRACIESILRCRVATAEREVICVDNSSTDATPAILRDFGTAIRVVREGKRGPAAARNAGLRVAAGTFVAFTDADCHVDPDWPVQLIRPLREGQAGATGGRILARPVAGIVERFGELVHDHRKAIEVDQPPYLITMNLALPLERLRSIGGFDERWIRMEDVDLTYRLVAAGTRLAYCPDAVVYHHNRDTLPTLMREAFLHGYYSPAFQQANRNFVDSFTASPSRTAPATDSPLKPWQVAALWSLFRNAKKVGQVAGHYFPPKLAE